MRNLLTDVKSDRHGLVFTVEVKWRHQQHTVRVHCPWKYLATDDIVAGIQRERERRLRPMKDPERPWLPLEKWE